MKTYLAITEESIYGLGCPKQAFAKIAALSKEHVGVELLKDIRESINKGLALGDGRFASEIEALTQIRITARTPGQPRILKKKK